MRRDAVGGTPERSEREVGDQVQPLATLLGFRMDAEGLLRGVRRRVAVPTPGDGHLDELLERGHHRRARDTGQDAAPIIAALLACWVDCMGSFNCGCNGKAAPPKGARLK